LGKRKMKIKEIEKDLKGEKIGEREGIGNKRGLLI
jgi:hypothetical protein